jgi:septum formation protein
VSVTHEPARVLILASSSPRRRELLALGGFDFEVRPAAAVEDAQPGESPSDYVQRLSRAKAGLVAAAVVAATAEQGAVVIGADTTVVLGEAPQASGVLGKPHDAREAADMLRRLRGRTHQVLTAISLMDTSSRAELDEVVTARVPMRAYGDHEIEAYVATGDPLDKAGAYAIQYPGFKPVDREHFTDCFATVMGLPVCRALRLLEQFGVKSRLSRPPADCRRFDPSACPIYPLISQDGGG